MAGRILVALVEDPWRIFPCDSGPAGCAVLPGDSDFTSSGRDALYYVRAIEEPSPAVDAAMLRCEYDAEGNCLRVPPCGGAVAYEDDCLAENEERAWSSPIFVDYSGP
jgi:hypothetical protein